MSTKGKSGFLLPKGMVWQDLGITERVGSFLDAIRAADQRYAAAAYERYLPSRVARQTPGRSGFGLPKGMVWQDLGISERFNPVGSHASRVDDDAYKQNYQQITQDDVNSGMFTTDPGFAEGYTPPVFQQLFNLAASQPVTGTVTGTGTGTGTSTVQEIDPYLGMSTKISDKPIDTYEQFVERTRNSPAMRAGVFDPKDLYQTYISDQDFQVARDTGNLEDFARAYPLSQTAKKMRSKVPYGRPVDF